MRSFTAALSAPILIGICMRIRTTEGDDGVRIEFPARVNEPSIIGTFVRRISLGTRNFHRVLLRQFGRSLSHQCRVVLPLTGRQGRLYEFLRSEDRLWVARREARPRSTPIHAQKIDHQCLDGVDRLGSAHSRELLVPPLLNSRLRSPLQKELPMRPRRILVACLTLTVSVGCTSLNQPNASPGPFPTDYKMTIRKHVLRSFFDPYSIRDASISEPVISRMGKPDGWLVCLEANAKNRMGGYTGLSRTAYYIRLGGQLETSSYGNYTCSGTRALTFSPWPELEQLQHQ